MKQSDEKDFEQAIDNHIITGSFILNKKYVLDYIFENIHFLDLRIINGSLTYSLFQKCKFTNVNFESMHLDNCDFKNYTFNNTIFKNCTTEGIVFTKCKSIPKIM